MDGENGDDGRDELREVQGERVVIQCREGTAVPNVPSTTSVPTSHYPLNDINDCETTTHYLSVKY